MPEYLTPGVYVEEVSFRSSSIEGVSTTTTAFIGPTRTGPTEGAPELVTSLAEYERIFGDGEDLVFTGAAEKSSTNYMWHAARAFFENGGRRLYVVRVCAHDGARARGVDGGFEVEARTPGAAGNLRVCFRLKAGRNAMSGAGENAILIGVGVGDTVLYRPAAADGVVQTWALGSVGQDGAGLKITPAGTVAGVSVPLARVSEVVPVQCDVEIKRLSGDLVARYEREDPLKLKQRFGEAPPTAALALMLPIKVNEVNFAGLVEKAKGDLPTLQKGVEETVELKDGTDGPQPGPTEYEGKAVADNDDDMTKRGLRALEDVEDVSIVAAPGSSALTDESGASSDARAIAASLISHCETMRYRVAILDSVPGHGLNSVRDWRAYFDSSYAALYYPWVRVHDPISRKEILLPPSGFVAGIYARNDINRAVWKAPANEVVQLALGFEHSLSHAQQGVLNPSGINCLRFFEGRGLRVWGARTMSSNAEWRYINVRRYFNYLERSIDRGTQWAVFEPNGPALWNNVRRSIEDFLLDEYQAGALLGDRPEKACFVRCDRTTMTQSDLDNGRLVCLVGVAALKPAEFVIFRIGQWTADSKN